MSRKLQTDCEGKVAFESATLAYAVVTTRRKAGRRSAYRCSGCGKWHLGNHKRTIHQNLRRRFILENLREDT